MGASDRSEFQGRSRLQPHRQVPGRGRFDDRAGREGAPADSRRAPAAGRREHPPSPGAEGTVRFLEHRGHQRPDAPGVRTSGAGRADEHHGAAQRRVGDRQGADRARDSLQLVAGEEALHQSELRGAAPRSDRVGAVRLREGGLHRRADGEEGRSSSPRAARFPRRNRRAQLGTQGELLRCCRSANSSVWGAPKPHAANIRLVAATNKDLEKAITAGIPRGPLLPAERSSRSSAAAARAPARYSSPRGFFVENFAREHARRSSASRHPASICGELPLAGNVRELANAIERATVVCDGQVCMRIICPTLQTAEASGTGQTASLSDALEAFEKDALQDA